MSSYTGDVVDIAWQAVDGDNLGLWYAWAIDDCVIGTKKIFSSDMSKSTLGYDIYRQDFGSGPFNKLNEDPVNDTTYLDSSLPAGEYNYFVNAVLAECNYFTSSDTINIDVITGINSSRAGRIDLFPNPASDILNIESVGVIKKVEMMNFIGQVVYTNPVVENKKHRVNVSTFQPGVYFVKVSTVGGIETAKITITR
jgi:hypothetical protein